MSLSILVESSWVSLSRTWTTRNFAKRFGLVVWLECSVCLDEGSDELASLISGILSTKLVQFGESSSPRFSIRLKGTTVGFFCVRFSSYLEYSIPLLSFDQRELCSLHIVTF